jgi:hypothetical protein
VPAAAGTLGGAAGGMVIRARDEGALIARAALESCIAGLYCLYSGEAVSRLEATDAKAARKSISYLTDNDLISKEAIDAAFQALGAQGPVRPDLKALGDWLAKERDIHIGELYEPYYVPLSHFFAHPTGFALMRHVRPDRSLTRRPAFPWARRSAVRMADMCAGLMASAIAEESGHPDEYYATYADPHLNRLLTPAFTVAAKGWRSNLRPRDLPRLVLELLAMRRYVRGPGLADPPATQEARVRDGFSRLFAPLTRDTPPQMFSQAIEEFVAMVLNDMRSRSSPDDRPRGWRRWRLRRKDR